MTTALTLEQVTDAFAVWRQTRPSRRAGTPELLKQQAVALNKRYPRKAIISALGISGGQYSQWMREAQPQVIEPITFVALPPVMDTTLQVVLHHPHGSRLEMHGLSQAQLACLVRSFTGTEVAA